MQKFRRDNEISFTLWVMQFEAQLNVMGITDEKKWSYLELFWSCYSVLRVILRISPYSVRMREHAGKIQTRISQNTDTFYAADTVTFGAVTDTIILNQNVTNVELKILPNEKFCGTEYKQKLRSLA